MIATFIETLTTAQMCVLVYFIFYGLLHGIKHHFIVLYAIFSGRGLSTDLLTTILNWLWYGSIACLLYWFV